MKRVKTLLTPGGYLILTEITVPSLCTSLIFGTLPGWWNGKTLLSMDIKTKTDVELAKEESRANGPLLTEAEWDDTLQRTGFTGADHILWDMPDPRYVNTEQIHCLLKVHV